MATAGDTCPFATGWLRPLVPERVAPAAPSSRWARTTVGVTMVIMFAAAIGMFIF